MLASDMKTTSMYKNVTARLIAIYLAKIQIQLFVSIQNENKNVKVAN